MTIDPRRNASADAIAHARGYLNGACIQEHYRDAEAALAAADAIDPARELLADLQEIITSYLTGNPDTYPAQEFQDDLRTLEGRTYAVLGGAPTQEPAPAARYRDKRERTRVIEVVGRCQARETFGSPIVFEVRVVAHQTHPERVGKTTYVSDRSLRSRYTRMR